MGLLRIEHERFRVVRVVVLRGHCDLKLRVTQNITETQRVTSCQDLLNSVMKINSQDQTCLLESIVGM